jgi:ubiquinone/menaquinone biosynthesis C-methylase UbiE
MNHREKHERRFHADAGRLRSPERLELLEVSRVIELIVQGLAVRTLLDVGTGTGVFAEAFSGLGLEVTGIDANIDLLASARTYVPNGRFVEAQAENMPFEDRSFDIVFLGHVLHETDFPLQALREARRTARMRVGILEWPYREEEHGPPLVHRLEPEEIMSLTQQAGFENPERIRLDHMELFRLTP